MMGWSSRCYIPSFVKIVQPVLEKIFEGFLPYIGVAAILVMHTRDISLFRRELPIFCLFLRKSPYENFQNFLYILYVSLFGISDLPTKIEEFPSLFNHSPYLEKKISLFVFWDVSHVCGHVTSIMSSDFHFLVPETLHTKFGSDRHSSLRKSGLNFCMYTTLGQGQEMTLTFNTHIPSYIQLDVCCYQLSGHWLQ